MVIWSNKYLLEICTNFRNVLFQNINVPVKIWWDHGKITSTDVFSDGCLPDFVIALWVPKKNLLVVKDVFFALIHLELLENLQKEEGIEIKYDFE